VLLTSVILLFLFSDSFNLFLKGHRITGHCVLADHWLWCETLPFISTIEPGQKIKNAVINGLGF
jgi:hypothetical protein